MIRHTLILMFLTLLSASILSAESTERFSAIILINGQATLVEMDKKGEHIKRHMDIPEYFRTSVSHETLLKRYKAKLKSLSSNRPYKAFDKAHFLAAKKSRDANVDLLDKSVPASKIANLHSKKSPSSVGVSKQLAFVRISALNNRRIGPGYSKRHKSAKVYVPSKNFLLSQITSNLSNASSRKTTQYFTSYV